MPVANVQIAIPTPVYVTFVDQEVPSGAIDGVNRTYTLVNAPNPPSSLHLHKNGIRQFTPDDYSLAGNTIIFVTAPQITPIPDVLSADYRY